MKAPYVATEPYIASPPSGSQASLKHKPDFWIAFTIVILTGLVAIAWWLYSPRQDHIGAITMNGDDSWFYNYELGVEMQDPEILYDGTGQSIHNAQQADIIIIGWSRLLFGLDWRVADRVAQQRHLKIFNLGIASVYSGEFYLKIIQKWHLHPKLFVINADRDVSDYRNSFFFMALNASGTDNVVRHGWLTAYTHVIGRNIRWRAQDFLGELHPYQYRSAVNGAWNVDAWPNYRSSSNKPITLQRFEKVDDDIVDDYLILPRDSDSPCPAFPQEIAAAKDYGRDIDAAAVLIQVPSTFACAQRIREIADAVGIPAFTVNPTQYTSVDGGGHLDGISAHRWSTQFFDWLTQLPQFQQAFPHEEK
jgi:hypothetical protein